MNKTLKAAESGNSPTFGRNISRTMELAQDVSFTIYQPKFKAKDHPMTSSAVKHTTLQSSPKSVPFQPKLGVYQSKEAQYWAERALAAEAQLQLARSASKEIQRVVQYRERLVRLEWIVMVLLGLIAVLVSLVVYLFASRPSPRNAAAHFTIPILSPFTSVVEHETSVIGSKTIVLMVLTVAALAYCVIRFRLWR